MAQPDVADWHRLEDYAEMHRFVVRAQNRWGGSRDMLIADLFVVAPRAA